MNQIKVVGVGGVGIALLSTLCRYLDHQEEKYRITLIDGDEFEPKNSNRQAFTTSGNKAKIKSQELGTEFKNLAFRPISEFLTPENIDDLIGEGDLIMSCVDNHDTRRLLSKHCESLDDAILISGGNELTDGNVQVFIRIGGKNKTSPLTKYHPEIENPEDKNPGELSCEERARLPESRQIIFTNMGVAWIMLSCFWLIEISELDRVGEHFFDIMLGKMQLVNRNE